MPLDGTALPKADGRIRNGPAKLTHVAAMFSSPAVLSAARTVWESALCAQVDPELFFPEVGEHSPEAKAICAVCPVRAACLEVFGDLVSFGVLGGLSSQERRARRVAARKDGAAA